MNTKTKQTKEVKTSAAKLLESKEAATKEAAAKEASLKPQPKKRGRPKKLSIAKDAMATIAELSQSIKTGLLSRLPTGEQKPLDQKEVDKLSELYKSMLEQAPKNKLGKLCQDHLSQLRDSNLSKARMPEIIESHADISMLNESININGGYLRLARGNWVQIDLGSKERNAILKEVMQKMGEPINAKHTRTSILPTTFLKRIDGILAIIESLNPTASNAEKRDNENQTTLISWACMAYLEIIEEQGQEPPEDVAKPSQRPYKEANNGIALLKNLILEQANESVPPEGTPVIEEAEIRRKIQSSVSIGFTTREAAELSCVFAERELEAFKHSFRRETLFKMRAFLSSKFFEIAKQYRAEGGCPSDKILTQKPRYKTPCVWLVINRDNQRCEILPLKPTTNVTYWGNPDSEKDKYSIVAIEQPQTIWDSIDIKALKQSFIKHQSLVSWSVALVSLFIVALGSLVKLPGSHNQSQQKVDVAIEQDDLSPMNFDLSENLANNTKGNYSLNIKNPSNKNSTSKQNSMEW